jgi:hypothetical protein
MSPPCKYIEFWSGERQNESHKGVVPTSFDQPPAMQTFTRDPVGIEELPFATELDEVSLMETNERGDVALHKRHKTHTLV